MKTTGRPLCRDRALSPDEARGGSLDRRGADQAPQEGILNIRDFAVRGEGALDASPVRHSSRAGSRQVWSSRGSRSISTRTPDASRARRPGEGP